MKILFLTHQYLPHHVGGTELMVHGLAKSWQAQGGEAAVLTYREAAGQSFHDFGLRETCHDGVPVTEVHFNLTRATHPAEAEYHFPLLAELVRRAVRQICPDVVHVAHLLRLSAAVVPMLKEEGLPVVVTLSDFWPICLRHTLLRWDHQVCHSGPVGPLTCLGCAQATYGYPQGSGVETQAALALAQGADYPEHRFAGEVRAVAQRNAVLRACLLAADRLIALSRFAQEKFREHGYPGDRLELLEHGVDALQLAAGRAQRQSQPPAPPLGTLDRPLRLVFMATLAPHKGLHVLLAALEQIPHAPVLLEVYGPDGGGDYPQQLRRSAARDSRISFQGPVSAEKVGEILAQAHVLACPAQWYENDPLVVKSAFSLGVPVVASRLGSLEEMITRSGFGWLLPPTDILAWAAWMEEKAAGGWEPPSPPAAVPTVTSFAAALFPIYQSLCPTL